MQVNPAIAFIINSGHSGGLSLSTILGANAFAFNITRTFAFSFAANGATIFVLWAMAGIIFRPSLNPVIGCFFHISSPF
jgi:hypothetical protein